jgi:hypothetical protein
VEVQVIVQSMGRAALNVYRAFPARHPEDETGGWDTDQLNLLETMNEELMEWAQGLFSLKTMFDQPK